MLLVLTRSNLPPEQKVRWLGSQVEMLIRLERVDEAAVSLRALEEALGASGHLANQGLDVLLNSALAAFPPALAGHSKTRTLMVSLVAAAKSCARRWGAVPEEERARLAALTGCAASFEHDLTAAWRAVSDYDGSHLRTVHPFMYDQMHLETLRWLHAYIVSGQALNGGRFGRPGFMQVDHRALSIGTAVLWASAEWFLDTAVTLNSDVSELTPVAVLSHFGFARLDSGDTVPIPVVDRFTVEIPSASRLVFHITDEELAGLPAFEAEFPTNLEQFWRDAVSETDMVVVLVTAKPHEAFRSDAEWLETGWMAAFRVADPRAPSARPAAPR